MVTFIALSLIQLAQAAAPAASPSIAVSLTRYNCCNQGLYTSTGGSVPVFKLTKNVIPVNGKVKVSRLETDTARGATMAYVTGSDGEGYLPLQSLLREPWEDAPGALKVDLSYSAIARLLEHSYKKQLGKQIPGCTDNPSKKDGYQCGEYPLGDLLVNPKTGVADKDWKTVLSKTYNIPGPGDLDFVFVMGRLRHQIATPYTEMDLAHAGERANEDPYGFGFRNYTRDQALSPNDLWFSTSAEEALGLSTMSVCYKLPGVVVWHDNLNFDQNGVYGRINFGNLKIKDPQICATLSLKFDSVAQKPVLSVVDLWSKDSVIELSGGSSWAKLHMKYWWDWGFDIDVSKIEIRGIFPDIARQRFLPQLKKQVAAMQTSIRMAWPNMRELGRGICDGYSDLAVGPGSPFVELAKSCRNSMKKLVPDPLVFKANIPENDPRCDNWLARARGLGFARDERDQIPWWHGYSASETVGCRGQIRYQADMNPLNQRIMSCMMNRISRDMNRRPKHHAEIDESALPKTGDFFVPAEMDNGSFDAATIAAIRHDCRNEITDAVQDSMGFSAAEVKKYPALGAMQDSMLNTLRSSL